MNFCAREGAQVKIARTTTAKDKTRGSLVHDLIKQAKALHIFRGRIPLTFPAFADRGFVQLSIIAPNELHQIPGSIRRGQGVPANALGINTMRLF